MQTDLLLRTFCELRNTKYSSMESEIIVVMCVQFQSKVIILDMMKK